VLLWNNNIFEYEILREKLYLKDEKVEYETLENRIKMGEFIEVMEFERIEK
jgi:hypothetical protein